MGNEKNNGSTGRTPAQRGSGRVPPPDAFDNLPRRLPPPAVRRRQAEQEAARRAEKQRQARSAPGKAGKGAKKKTGGKPAAAAQKAKAPAPATPKKKKRPASPARRRRNRRIFAALGIVLLIGLGVWFSFNVLFKIEGYALEGESPYTEEEVALAFGHEPGENMFGFSASSAKKRLEQTLPYIEDVVVRRRLPGTVVFKITPAVETYYLEWQGQYAVLSARRKVLRFAAEEPQNLVHIRGLSGLGIVPGLPLALVEGPLAAAPEDPGPDSVSAPPPADSAPSEADVQQTLNRARLDTLDALLDALADETLADIAWVDVSDTLNMQLCWEGRVTVRLGTRTDLDKKLGFALLLLCGNEEEQAKIGPEERGTLDVSAYPAKLDRVWFTPG